MKKKTVIILMVLISTLTACEKKTDIQTNKEEAVKEKDVVTEENVETEGEKINKKDTKSEIDSLEGILEEITNDYTETIDCIKSELNKVHQNIGDTYQDYVENKEELTDWYDFALDESESLYKRTDNNVRAYYEKVLEEINLDEYDDVEDAMDNIYEAVYEDAMDEYYDVVYEDLLDEVKDIYYDGIIENGKDSVEYGDWLDEYSECYSDWLDSRSDIYSIWLDYRSDFYSDWLNVNSACYLGDVNLVEILDLSDVSETSEFDKEELSEETESVKEDIPDEERKQKDGFDKATNVKKTIGNYNFQIPDYWEIDIDEENKYRAYAEENGKVAMLNIMIIHDDTDKVTYEILKEETLDGRMSEAITSSLDESGDVVYEEYSNSKIKGYVYKNVFTNDGTDGYMETLYFPSETDNSWVCVQIMESDNTEYSYINDFREIINSIEIEKEETDNIDISIISPDFKKVMDDYEVFIDEYIEFMNKFNEADTNDMLNLMTEYNDYMEKYTEVMEGISNIDEDELSTADALYYAAVNARVSKKLLEIRF